MRYKNTSLRILTAAAISVGLFTVAGAPQKDGKTNPSTTSEQPRNNTSDRDLTQKVRQAVEADTSLSTYAHNVKIFTRNGTVTLKGAVRSQDEKKAVEAKAAEVAGAGNVVNDLIVKPEKANRKVKPDESAKEK
jgi:osmotically-inducible protein OsmY